MANSWISVFKTGLGLRRYQSIQKCFLHRGNYTKEDIQKRRADLFIKEAERQKGLITNIEKISVDYQGYPENVTLVMNKGLSTPYDCSMHCSSTISDQCALAEVDGEVWDMHRPLNEDCSLRFLHFQEADPYFINKAFWKSLSILMGSLLEISFKEHVDLEICSIPPPNVRSGSFVYDVSMNQDSWTPTKKELISLSAKFMKLALKRLRFDVLEVKEDVAMEIFKYNPFKLSQIPSIAEGSKYGCTVTLVKVGDYVDISGGPFIGDTRYIGRCSITAVHKLEIDGYNIYRCQGVALPKSIMINQYAYKLIQERAARFNPCRIPVIEDKRLLQADNV